MVERTEKGTISIILTSEEIAAKSKPPAINPVKEIITQNNHPAILSDGSRDAGIIAVPAQEGAPKRQI